MSKSPLSLKEDQRIVDLMMHPKLALDPYKFVLAAYPWGRPNTPLANRKGPKRWQADILQEIAAHLHAQTARTALDMTPQLYRQVLASGRGIGKSALVGWLSHWMLSTCIGSTTMVSANSEPQLTGTTFPEIKKWIGMGLNAHWFETETLTIKPTSWFADLALKQLGIESAYYYVKAKLWTEENPDSYAGPHSSYGMLLLFDEASGIPSAIWENAQGFFTDVTLKRFWLAFSQGRRNSGGFFERFQPGSDWLTRSIDARTVEESDQEIYNSIIRKHGIDGDVTRVEVLGLFPRSGQAQFISSEKVYSAQQRQVVEDPHAALIMGVDVARANEGDDSVIRWRQGRDAKSIPPRRFSGLDNMELADKVAQAIDETRPDAVAIDAGNGTGVIDRLRQLRYRNIHEVWFGSKSSQAQYANKRTEMYGDAEAWLDGGMLDDCPLLFGDLTKVEYKRTGKGGDITILEPKEDLKKRIGRSPDDGDAFVLTFAPKVARRDLNLLRGRRRVSVAEGVDYPVYG